MSKTDKNPRLQKVKYSNFKNEADVQTLEIIVPPMKGGTKDGTFGFKPSPSLKLTSISVIAIIIVIVIIVSCTMYFKIIPKENCLKTNYDVETTTIIAQTISGNTERFDLTKIGGASDEKGNENPNRVSDLQSGNYSQSTCVPVKSVEKVILVDLSSHAYENSCYDNATCHALLKKIEHEHNGLKYNFIIGTADELYIGLGFKCLSNSSESALNIKYFESMNSEIPCLRVNEVIDQGILCGYISKNATIQVKGMSYSYDIFNSSKWCHNIHEHEQNRALHFHDPNYEMSTLIHRDIKWTVCGNFSYKLNMKQSRVITLENIPISQCVPLDHVNEIKVEVIETNRFNCSNSSCTENFEEQHDGLRFNFIIGHDDEVYVGLGFRCRADLTSGNVLKVKVLESFGATHVHLTNKNRKFFEILEEGIACGKVLEDFTVKANCHEYDSTEARYGLCEYRYEKYHSKAQLVYTLNYSFGIFNEDRYNISSEGGTGIVPAKHRYSICNREHSGEHTTAAPGKTDDTSSIYDMSSSEYDYYI